MFKLFISNAEYICTSLSSCIIAIFTTSLFYLTIFNSDVHLDKIINITLLYLLVSIIVILFCAIINSFIHYIRNKKK